MFNKYGLKCTFNLNSACLGESGSVKCCGKVVNHNKVKAEDVKEIYKGHEVACHTLTHPDLTKLDDKTVIYGKLKKTERLLKIYADTKSAEWRILTERLTTESLN